MFLYAYVSRQPIGRLAFFLLSAPISLIDRILEENLQVDNFNNLRSFSGVLLLSIIALGFVVNLRHNRLLDLNWLPFWRAIAMWSPVAASLFMLISGGPENYHLIPWPIAVLAGTTLATSVLTGFALVLTPGAKARARKNTAIPVNPTDRRNLIRPA